LATEFDAVVWIENGATEMTPEDVDLAQELADAGTPLYFLGDSLLAAASQLPADRQSQWQALIHLRTGGSTWVNSVAIDTREAHPVVTDGRVGTVRDFDEPIGPDQAAVATEDPNAVVLGRSGGFDVLVASRASLDVVRTVTQHFRVVREGEPPSQSLAEREKLFENAVWWLLGAPCGLADLTVRIEGSPIEVEVGGRIDYVITVSHAGECPALGVTLTDPLPPGLKLLEVESEFGTVETQDGVVTFHLGKVGGSEVRTLVVHALATTAGAVLNSVTVQARSPEVSAENNYAPSAPVTVLPSTDPPAELRLDRHSDGQLGMVVIGAAGQNYAIESSADLQSWQAFAEASIDGRDSQKEILVAPELPRRFFRATRK
jgi:uncharacterized repeat protein (TIGR01451 family)